MSVEFTIFKDQGGKIVKDVTRKAVRPDEVLVKITHSGLCFSDVHLREKGIALGHEGVGIVERLGGECMSFKLGDHVGWGFVRNTCGQCDMCLEGEDMYCPQGSYYGSGDTDQGSFASHTVVRESFLFLIPSSIPLSHAGPLMCGGATVFEVLSRFSVKPTDRVGVIGVGGLGHLAIQFAAKMGCEVVVFSSSESKRDEAFEMGAKEYHATKNVQKLEMEKKLNCLLVTTSVQPDWNLFIPILAPKSTIFPLTVDPEGALDVPAMPVTTRCLCIQGSAVGSRRTFRKMLDFASQHDILPIIMEFPMTTQGIEEAFETLEAGKMRYRGVLVTQDGKEPEAG